MPGKCWFCVRSPGTRYFSWRSGIVVSPIAALLLCAVCTLSGTALFVTRAPSRAWRPDPAAGSHGVLGALRSGGVRTIMVATVPIGFCFGTVEISLPAFAIEHGAPAWAGALLSVWAAASAVGGLAYGARTFSTPLPRVYLWLAALLPLGFLPALAAPSVAAFRTRPAASLPELSIGDVTVVEGDTGQTTARLVLSLSAPAPAAVSINVETVDGTAFMADFVSEARMLQIPAGQTSVNFDARVRGDTVVERDEVFAVAITAATPNRQS